MSTKTRWGGSSMKTAISILGWIAVLMGIVHISFTLPISELRVGHLWFIGSGITIVFAGFINVLAQISENSRPHLIVALVTNSIMCAMFIAATFVLNESQVYFGIVLFAALGVLTILKKKRQLLP
jgi:hypothetical protein